MEKEIHLPENSSGQSIVKSQKSLLVVGANGAGKTRLGTWIEFNSPDRDKVHRISAQKSLAMPDSTTPNYGRVMSVQLSKTIFTDTSKGTGGKASQR